MSLPSGTNVSSPKPSATHYFRASLALALGGIIALTATLYFRHVNNNRRIARITGLHGTSLSRSYLKSFSSFLLTAALLAVAMVAFEPKAFGQEGKGASSDDWFIKSAEDRKETPQTSISGGEKRDIIPSVRSTAVMVFPAPHESQGSNRDKPKGRDRRGPRIANDAWHLTSRHHAGHERCLLPGRLD